MADLATTIEAAALADPAAGPDTTTAATTEDPDTMTAVTMADPATTTAAMAAPDTMEAAALAPVEASTIPGSSSSPSRRSTFQDSWEAGLMKPLLSPKMLPKRSQWIQFPSRSRNAVT